MLDRLKNFVPRRWWFALIALGLVIVVAAVAANNNDVALIGLGIVAGGFGEWMNHRMEMDFVNRAMLAAYHRDNRPTGDALDGVGFILIVAGLYHVLS